MYETCNISAIELKLHHSRAADSTISTVGITAVKSMIESLRIASLVTSGMKDPPATRKCPRAVAQAYCLLWAALGPLGTPASTAGGPPEARQWPSLQPDFGRAD